MNITTNQRDINAGKVLDAEAESAELPAGAPRVGSYGRPVTVADIDGVENAYGLYVDRLTELLANLAAEGLVPARLGIGMLPNPYEATDDLGELRDVVENGGMS